MQTQEGRFSLETEEPGRMKRWKSPGLWDLEAAGRGELGRHVCLVSALDSLQNTWEHLPGLSSSLPVHGA